MKKGDIIDFQYKENKQVSGRIYNIVRQIAWIILTSDYKGKNDEWDAGEIKPFNIKEMSKIIIKTK